MIKCTALHRLRLWKRHITCPKTQLKGWKMRCNCLFTVIIIWMKLLLSSSTQSSSFILRSNSTSAVSNSNHKVPRRSTVEWDIELGLESGGLNQEGNSQTQQVLDKKRFLHSPDFLWRRLIFLKFSEGATHCFYWLLHNWQLHTHYRNALTNVFTFIYLHMSVRWIIKHLSDHKCEYGVFFFSAGTSFISFLFFFFMVFFPAES